MKLQPIAIALFGLLGSAAPVVASELNARAAADPDVRVEISNVRGSITVTAWDRPEVQVSGDLGEGSELEFEGEGQRISVQIESPKSSGWSWWGGDGAAHDTRLEVSVPRGAALDVDAVSADVRIDGIRGSREVSVDSVSGDQRLDVESQRLKIGSVSGDVDITGAAARSDIETVSGDVVASGLSGEIDLQTVSGDARVTGGSVDRVSASTISGTIELDVAPNGAARIKGEALSGEWILRVPADLSARIEADSFSGRIRSDFGQVDEDEYGPGRKLRATVGSGAATITIESFSGDVEIRKR